MPSFDQLAKAISAGIAAGVLISALGMTISYASTGTNQLPTTEIQNEKK